MFGKPRFSDARFLFSQFSNGLNATVQSMEREHPDATTTDTQAMMGWILACILYAIRVWGRTDENAVKTLFLVFGRMIQENPQAGGWDLDQFGDEVERWQEALRSHALLADHETIKEAAGKYYQGLIDKEPAPALTQADFIRFGVTIFYANVARLKNGGHIRL